jgi:hypothetical protein
MTGPGEVRVMGEKEQKQQPDGLNEEELEQANGEPLPDREAMSVITPLVSPPDFTLPVEPDE